MALTLKEICEAISADRIGTTKQTVSNQMTGKRRFSNEMAKKYSDAFGYSLPWLLFGEGDMFKEGYFRADFDHEEHQVYYVGNYESMMKEGLKLKVAERLLQILNNKIAISAFKAYLDNNYDEYVELRDQLERDYGYDLPHFSSDPNRAAAFRQIREFFTQAETQAAKDLVMIEHKVAKGEILDVDAETERFRKKLLDLKAVLEQEKK